METDKRQRVNELLKQLQAPVANLTTLFALLSTPLEAIGLLPPQFRHCVSSPLPEGAVDVRKHIPFLQRIILEHIAPTWDVLIAEKHADSLLEQYFCPDGFSNASICSGEVAISAYSTLVSSALEGFSMRMLERLTVQYPLDRLHTAVFAGKHLDVVATESRWQDCVHSLTGVPAKVANAAGNKNPIPRALEHGFYFNSICTRCEQLIFELAKQNSKGSSVASVTYLLLKLVNLGVFPPNRPVQRSQPSFFETTLSTIRSRLSANDSQEYSIYWHSIFLNVPSILALRSILTSLFATLPVVGSTLDPILREGAFVKRDAFLLFELIGPLVPETQEVWDIAVPLIIERDWGESFARIFVCWISGSFSGKEVNAKVLYSFLQDVLETWSSPEHIKHSLLSRHRYVTSLLLLAASYLPPNSQYTQSLASSSSFVQAIGKYISHYDGSVRRCGMLAGEVVASMCDKKLDFGDWDGEDAGKPWARGLRQLLKKRDVESNTNDFDGEDNDIEREEIPAYVPSGSPEAETPLVTFPDITNGCDSDDSLTGYASQNSSRSASPSPSDLAEIERDPTLNVGIKKVARPVYLAQLGDLLRSVSQKSGPDDPHDADKIEMALNCAEELIRKKKDYGTELHENAVHLVYQLLSLNDNYDLDDFAEKRQGSLNALISCSPRKAAPVLIEEFFKNQYSTDQRNVALNALAVGARELASLPVPPSRVSSNSIAFPSKTLSAPLHRKYVLSSRTDTGVVPRIMDDISCKSIDKQRDPGIRELPQLSRERRLRIRKSPEISEVVSTRIPSQISRPLQRPAVCFTDVAAEYFLVPLINRFWQFLRDEQTREQRTSHHKGQSYRGAGTGLILNPLVLSQFLRTVAILVHASQNAPEWLAIIAVNALELAVTIGTQPVSRTDTELEWNHDTELGVRGQDASVLTAALELALVVLDGSHEVDGGKLLSLEHTTILLGTGEWAGKVFSALEKGIKAEGGGGLHEVKLRRAAAGVLLKVDEITSVWKRSMLDTR